MGEDPSGPGGSESGPLRWLSAGVLPADELQVEVKRRQLGKYITPIKNYFSEVEGSKILVSVSTKLEW